MIVTLSELQMKTFDSDSGCCYLLLRTIGLSQYDLALDIETIWIVLELIYLKDKI